VISKNLIIIIVVVIIGAIAGILGSYYYMKQLIKSIPTKIKISKNIPTQNKTIIIKSTEQKKVEKRIKNVNKSVAVSYILILRNVSSNISIASGKYIEVFNRSIEKVLSKILRYRQFTIYIPKISLLAYGYGTELSFNYTNIVIGFSGVKKEFYIMIGGISIPFTRYSIFKNISMCSLEVSENKVKTCIQICTSLGSKVKCEGFCNITKLPYSGNISKILSSIENVIMNVSNVKYYIAYIGSRKYVCRCGMYGGVNAGIYLPSSISQLYYIRYTGYCVCLNVNKIFPIYVITLIRFRDSNMIILTNISSIVNVYNGYVCKVLSKLPMKNITITPTTAIPISVK